MWVHLVHLSSWELRPSKLLNCWQTLRAWGCLENLGIAERALVEEVCFYFSNLSCFKFLNGIGSILETPQKGLLVLFLSLISLKLAFAYFICTALPSGHCCLFSQGEYLFFHWYYFLQKTLTKALGFFSCFWFWPCKIAGSVYMLLYLVWKWMYIIK